MSIFPGLKKEGHAFGGDVYSLPSDDLCKFFDASDFAKSGKRSFYRTIGISESSFDLLRDDLKKQIIMTQKNHARDKEKNSLSVLVENHTGRVIYVSSYNPLGNKDPADLLNVDKNNGWSLFKKDIDNGVIRYVYRGNIHVNEMGFIPVGFLDVPVFYNEPIRGLIGLLRFFCLNSLIRGSVEESFSIDLRNPRHMATAHRALRSFLDRIRDDDTYKPVLERMGNTPKSIIEARWDIESLVKEKKIPMALKLKAAAYFDIIESGRRTDDPVPRKIESDLDVVNVLTFYSQQLPSIDARTQADRNIYSHYAEKYHGKNSSLPNGNWAEVREEIKEKMLTGADTGIVTRNIRRKQLKAA
jgi:hypothetical protein